MHAFYKILKRKQTKYMDILNVVRAKMKEKVYWSFEKNLRKIVQDRLSYFFTKIKY
jgi:hypothetical protein